MYMFKRCLFLLLLLAGCSWLPVNDVGHVPPAEERQAIRVGKTTKQEVVNTIGSPATISLFEKESWIYIASKEQTRGFLEPKEIDRQVFVITFNAHDVVEATRFYTLQDGNDLVPDKTTTKTYGKDLSSVEELLGNFGRFPANKGTGR